MRYDLLFKDVGFHSALLTTFSMDPRIFEDVALPALRTANCRNIGVLVDRDRLNHQLTDFGPARRAGRSYHLSKIKVNGAFHPKIILQLGGDRGRLIVGSGNLTGAGLITNLEAATRITVTPDDQRAAPLFASALAYIESHIARDDVVLRDVVTRARSWTPWLDGVAAADEIELDGRRLMFVSDAAGPIAERLNTFRGDDKIRRLIMVSPYWDKDLSGMRSLRDRLGGPAVSMVVDDCEQDFEASAIAPLEGVTLHSSAALTSEKSEAIARRLHAKIIIAMGERADYVLAGSANGSVPALYGRQGGEGNAEACLLTTEDPGAALGRLGLSSCLAEVMALSRLQARRRTLNPWDLPPVIDGGTMRFEDERLIWTPPRGVDPAACEIRFTEDHAAGQMRSKETSDEWIIILPEGVAPDQLGHAIIRFPDGRDSAPVVIALVDKLAIEARPRARGPAKAILDRIGLTVDVDAEMFDLASRLISELLKEASLRASAKIRKSVPDDSADKGVILSEAEFGRLAELHLGPNALAAQPLLDLRRIANRHLGLSQNLLEDDIDLEDDWENSNRDEDYQDEGDQSGGQRSSGGSRGRSASIDRSEIAPELRKGVGRAARQQAATLMLRTRETVAALRGDTQPLVYLNSIRLHLLINAVLHHAAPVGQKATDRRPFHATDPAQGWIRSIGSLLVALEGALHRARPTMGNEREGGASARLDMLGTALFAGFIALDGARLASLSAAIMNQLVEVNARLAKFITTMIGDDNPANLEVRRRITTLQLKHGHLAPTPPDGRMKVRASPIG